MLEVMTAPQTGNPPTTDRPACTPAAIRAVLAANADPETLQRYDRELDTAFEQARHASSRQDWIVVGELGKQHTVGMCIAVRVRPGSANPGAAGH
jgi:hypothetical protein